MRDAATHYIDDELYMESVRLRDIAEAVGTPTFVYSSRYLEQSVASLSEAFAATPHRIHYSVKANSNLAVLRLFKTLGVGFDIVSGGELGRLLAIDADPASVIFSGVGKSIEEIDLALKLGIGCFNVESRGELERIADRAALLHVTAPISLRVNPDVDAKTHPYISTGLKQNKFGISLEQARELYQDAAANQHLLVRGIDCHIGSQINDAEPLLKALTSMLALVDELAAAGIHLDHVDIGGGLGIRYQDENALDVHAYGASVQQIMGSRQQTLLLEPGRWITANAGVLLTRVEYLKPATDDDAPHFAVVDAAMNDLIRPALYQAWHDIKPLRQRPDGTQLWDVVGPVCESGDFLAKARALTLEDRELLAVCSAGAYGMVQASNYNSRNRACEILVRDDSFELIRRRETLQDQLRPEQFGLEQIGLEQIDLEQRGLEQPSHD